MQEFITVLKKPIMWEALPTIVLKNYRDSGEVNPYTQCRICAVNNDLYIRLFSFETNPSAESEIKLYLSANGAVAEFLQTPSGVYARAKGGEGRVYPIDNIKASEIGGENNQGIYWGFEFSVSNKVLKDVFGIKSLLPNLSFDGEIVKQKDGESPHFGTLFAKEDKNFFERVDFDGKFVVVGY